MGGSQLKKGLSKRGGKDKILRLFDRNALINNIDDLILKNFNIEAAWLVVQEARKHACDLSIVLSHCSAQP